MYCGAAMGLKLPTPVDSVFDHLRAGHDVWRQNLSVTADPTLFHPERTPPPADLSAANAGERVWVRSERHTLRRMTRTESVLFTIKSRAMARGVW